MNHLLWVPVLLWFLAADTEDAAEVIRLKVGVEVVGRITDFDEARGVSMLRAGDHSFLEITWDQMHPEDVRRIRADRGYLPDESEPIYVEATRVLLTTGVEMVGRIVESNEETFVLRDAKGARTLRHAQVREREKMQVNALLVFDGEELYAEQLYSGEPQTALDHYNLALLSESLFLWNRVKEHLDQALALDPSFKEEIIGAKLKRAELRLSVEAEAQVLSEANQLANARHFLEALKKIEGFIDQNPQSPLLAEFAKDQKKIEQMRGKWLKEQVAVNFFALIERFAGRLALDTQVAIQEARKQMDQEATRLVMESLGKKLDAMVEEIEKIWASPDRIFGSAHTFSYGAGSFTLGAEKALEGFEKEGDEKNKAGGEGAAGEKAAGKEKGGEESLKERLEKLIAERKKQQEQREKQGPKSKKAQQATIYDVPPTQEEWWTSFSTTNERKAYLMAFWAERDEHVKKIGVSPRTCVRCSGEGILTISTQEKGEVQQPCDRCKGLRVDRVVKVH